MIIFNWNQNKVSWCIIENDHDFERNEGCVTVFLKWTDFKADRDWTPLHLAAKYGHLDICKLLMKYIEDKNPPNIVYVTPLHMAVLKGHLAVCELIIENAIDKNPEDYSGTTPLHLAVFNQNIEIVNLFTSKIEGVNPMDMVGKDEIINTFYKSLDC